jgi:hypothetical protein
MVLRNCSKSPTGKHAPAGALIKGTYILGILIGIIFGIIELSKYLNVPGKLTTLINIITGKFNMIIENIKSLI